MWWHSITTQTAWILHELLLLNLLFRGLKHPFVDDNCVATFSSDLKEALVWCTDNITIMGPIHPSRSMDFLNPDLVYLLVGVEGYCCTGSYTHMLVLGRSPLEKGWVHCRGLYLYSTHHIPAPSRIWTWNASKLLAADLCLDQAGQNVNCKTCILNNSTLKMFK